MKKKSLFISAMIGFTILAFSFSGCRKDAASDPSQSASNGQGNVAGGGISSAIPTYYDAQLFKIIFVEFSSSAEANFIAHNPGINFIYQSDNGLPNNQPFISVIDAIPGDGMNPVWQEVQIVFNAGFTPHQLYSDDEIFAAAAAAAPPNPEITLTKTTEVYYCPIVGHK